MTVAELIEKLKEMPPNVPVEIAYQQVCRSDSASWSNDAWAPIREVNDLASRVVIEFEQDV